MKGDFSRLTDIKAKTKHYNGVWKQQGRVQLDSDWNELISIISHQRKIRTIDTIGNCGAPIHHSGYEILHPGNGLNDLLITSGRFYAGGLLCETTPSTYLIINNIAGDGTLAVDDIKIDGENLEVGQWVQIITDETQEGIIGQLTVVSDGQLQINQDLSSITGDSHPFLRQLILFSEQPDFPQPTEYVPVENQTDILYLDVWERHITAIEDPLLREVALGGPDTDTRTKIISQVKVLPNVGDLDCEDESDDWNDLIKKPNGRLTTGLVIPADPIDPCQLGESGGFLGMENHLYRVEIHTGSSSGTPGFKWSRDNAAFAYGISEFFPEGGGQVFKISLQQNGKDDILKIKQQDWIEVSGDETDLDIATAGTLAKVISVEGNVLTLDTDISAHINEEFPKIRRWEISNQRPDVTTEIIPGTPFQLEDGIEIEFSGSEFNVGDYWVFSARALTGVIEILDKEPPKGMQHYHCKLAMVTGLSDGNVFIEDCRPEFPPLTELPPGEGGCCTVTVGENEDFQDIQEAIDFLEGGPGTVCIKPDVYYIDEPIIIEGEDITVKGCEGNGIIINTSDKGETGAIFRIQDSREVKIHDLWCLTTEGARAIEVENSLFFELYDCILVSGGISDLAGVISLQGLSINTKIMDNLMLGMIGIRYDLVEEQLMNLHVNARVERNMIFMIESGIFQSEETQIIGFDVIDNLMTGIKLSFLSKSFFPEKLFMMAEEYQLFDTKDLKKAKEERKKGEEFDRINQGDVQPVFDLSDNLKNESAETKALRKELSAVAYPTGKPIINLQGITIDANISDNNLIGSIGISLAAVLESIVNSNLVKTRQQGVVCGVLEGLSINDNFIEAGTDAIFCQGVISLNLTIQDNRLTGTTSGIKFDSNEKDTSFQMIWNCNIENNIISSEGVGISLENKGIILQDITVIDNTINQCQIAGILISVLDENQFTEEDDFNFQRVIQRNSIYVKGIGLFINTSDTKILDNDITIDAIERTNANTFGIILTSSNNSVINNSIHGIVDKEQNKFSNGGIQIRLNKVFSSTKHHHLSIKDNFISGGSGNGIEIGTILNGLVIEGNQIESMGLNGIAVQEHVRSLNDLSITGNHIHHCHQLAGQFKQWWKYAGIVLTSTKQASINDNIISDNGSSLNHQVTFISAIYAENIQNISISNNQLRNNEVPGILNRQAAIHIPIGINAINVNSGIQIINNIVKSRYSPALELGHYTCINFGNFFICFGSDDQAVITNNQFESEINGPIVQLQVSKLIFSNNHITCDPEFSVSLGYGFNIMANGNMVSDQITGAGLNQQVINTLQF